MANALETDVMRIIGESTNSPDVFDSTGIVHIRDAINDAVQEMCMVIGSYTKTYHLIQVADQQFYRMGWNQDYFGYVLECWDRQYTRKIEATDIFKLTAEDPWWMKRTGYILKYFPVGLDYIGIYRIPSADGGVLELKCVCIPKPYSNDTDQIKLKEAHQRAAVYDAVSKFYASRGNAVRATEYLKKYLETANLMDLNPEVTAERQYQFGGYQRSRVAT